MVKQKQIYQVLTGLGYPVSILDKAPIETLEQMFTACQQAAAAAAIEATSKTIVTELLKGFEKIAENMVEKPVDIRHN